MGECFITRRGGSTSKVFALISVNYPVGSTCTCTDGTETLTLEDTSGQGLFLIPYAALWTVTATYGTNTKSESVEIISEGQNESVTLRYILYVFKAGSGVKADWRITKDSGNAAYGGVDANEIWIGSSDSFGGSRATAGSVNAYGISGYTAIHFDIHCGSLANGSVTLGIASTNTAGSFVASAGVSSTGRQEISVDISKVGDGNYYVVATQTAWPARQTIYNIWFS